VQTVSWLQIAEDVRVRLNLPAYASGQIISLPIVATFIQQSANELAGMVRSGNADGYNTEVAFVQLQAGQNQYPLTGLGFIGLQKVMHAESAGSYPQIFRASADDILRFGTERRSWSDSRVTYRLRAGYIEFYPYPLHDAAVSIVYSKGFDIPSDLNAYATLEPGWREWIVNDVCARCAVRKNDDPNYHAANRDRVWHTIIEPGFGRDENAIQQVRDLRDQDEDFEMAMFRRGR
jgi:hypothetical protein